MAAKPEIPEEALEQLSRLLKAMAYEGKCPQGEDELVDISELIGKEFEADLAKMAKATGRSIQNISPEERKELKETYQFHMNEFYAGAAQKLLTLAGKVSPDILQHLDDLRQVGRSPNDTEYISAANRLIENLARHMLEDVAKRGGDTKELERQIAEIYAVDPKRDAGFIERKGALYRQMARSFDDDTKDVATRGREAEAIVQELKSKGAIFGNAEGEFVPPNADTGQAPARKR